MIRAAQDDAQARSGAFSSVVSGRIVWEKVLRDLSRVMPPNAYLSTLTASSPTASTAAAGGVPVAFSVAGSTSSQPAVALVLDRLALLPWLSGVTLQSSTRAGVGDVSVHDWRGFRLDRRLRDDRPFHTTLRDTRFPVRCAPHRAARLVCAGRAAARRRWPRLGSEIAAMEVQARHRQQHQGERQAGGAADPGAEAANRNARAGRHAADSAAAIRSSRSRGREDRGVTPTAPAAAAGSQAVPITLAIDGHYFGIANFLQLLRTKAELKGEQIKVSGRLYSVDSVSFSGTGGAGAGTIGATLALNAFTYAGAPAAAPTPLPTELRTRPARRQGTKADGHPREAQARTARRSTGKTKEDLRDHRLARPRGPARDPGAEDARPALVRDGGRRACAHPPLPRLPRLSLRPRRAS